MPDPGALVTGPGGDRLAGGAAGRLFAALPGTRADGHDFAAAAVAAGATAVLATRPVGVPALIVRRRPGRAGAPWPRRSSAGCPDLTIARITGSAGKTTTKDLTAQLVETLGPTVSNRGSFNNEIGHPLTVLRVTEQTRYLISELSARGPGHIAALCAIAPPRLGAVLCVGHAHAGEFGGIEAGGQGQERAARRAAGRRRGRAERRRPAGAGHGREHGGPGGDLRPVGGRRRAGRRRHR